MQRIKVSWVSVPGTPDYRTTVQGNAYHAKYVCTERGHGKYKVTCKGVTYSMGGLPDFITIR